MEKSIGFFLKRYNQLGAGLTKNDFSFQAPKCLRVNTLKITPEKLLKRLRDQNVQLEKISFLKNGYRIKKSRFSLGATPEFLLGYYYLQEAAAQVPVQVLQPKKGELVLDCCAAPGGKTTQIAQYMNNSGRIISFEKKKHRILSLMNNLERCGIKNCVVYNADATTASTKTDKILLDVPCSGNYALEKNWFKKRMSGIGKNTETQKALLKIAAKLIKKNGVIVYATCSLEPEENEYVIDWAIKNLHLHLKPTNLKVGNPSPTNVLKKHLHPSIKLCRRFWPNKTNTQGFFVAKLTR
jgi:tRNA (cytosine40_48-C5)-methyltransferase